jgi:hypothetical protein
MVSPQEQECPTGPLSLILSAPLMKNIPPLRMSLAEKERYASMTINLQLVIIIRILIEYIVLSLRMNSL